MTRPVVLVTGGAGYIGSHVCKSLAESGFLPVTYDNLSTGNEVAVQWGPLEIGDVRDREKLSAVLKTYKPVAILHFAAMIQVGDSSINPAAFYDNNVFGSWCLLEEARSVGIKHMVFSSTAAVYGIPHMAKLSEEHSLAPINPYGHTKLAMEYMIGDYAAAYSLNYAILRYFNAAGADPEAELGTAYPKDTHLIPLLMQVAGGLMPAIKIFGSDYPTPDGTAIRDYVHVTDLAEAHVLALRHIIEKEENLTLNLGTNEGYSVKEVLKQARLVTNDVINAEDVDRRAGDPPVLVADAGKAREILGWVPKYSDIKTILETAWVWRQKQNELGQDGAFQVTNAPISKVN